MFRFKKWALWLIQDHGHFLTWFSSCRRLRAASCSNRAWWIIIIRTLTRLVSWSISTNLRKSSGNLSLSSKLLFRLLKSLLMLTFLALASCGCSQCHSHSSIDSCGCTNDMQHEAKKQEAKELCSSLGELLWIHDLSKYLHHTCPSRHHPIKLQVKLLDLRNCLTSLCLGSGDEALQN